MRRRKVVGFLVAACLGPVASARADGEGEAWSRLLKETSYDLTEAIGKGVKEAGGGVPFHAELEEDKGVVVYSIDVAQGAKTCNVVLDAKKGQVVEKEIEDEDHSAAVGAAKTGLAAAVRTALGKGPGRAVEAHLVLRDGRTVVTIRSVHESTLTVVRVDGATGEVVADAASAAPDPFTDIFRVEAGTWTTRGANPHFPLEPGRYLVLTGVDDGKAVRVTIRVLDETRTVAGVETRVVEEREEKGGKLAEVSRNYLAVSKRTDDVYYFGEDVDVYEDGKVVSHEGAWLAGEKGARFGLLMPGTPLLGARHYQEIAPGIAMDRAEIVSLTVKIETPAGSFTDCVKVEETTPLESDKSVKVYAPGIGLVQDGPLRLAEHGRKK